MIGSEKVVLIGDNLEVAPDQGQGLDDREADWKVGCDRGLLDVRLEDELALECVCIVLILD